ncbi:MAG TPA: WhiB family transcriptional regulator [Acidimicrobiales bacterium]|nr:WhiB family transcriptional regulator [Acidimicrobiales bacterium]
MFAYEMEGEESDRRGAGVARIDWDAAGCRDGTGSMTDLFFSDDIPDIIEAKGICASCPVAGPCLAGALDRREPWGVWGGHLFLNGRILAQKRKRGRPPKNPRPDIPLTA